MFVWKINTWLYPHPLTRATSVIDNPTLVIPTRKNADYEQLSTSKISRVAMWLPPFWAKRPAVWFAQAEAQFTLAGITSEQTKFCYVISQLDQHYALAIEDIIVSPPKRNLYTALKTELVRRLSPSKEHRIRKLLILEELGNRKPSQLPRYLRNLAPDLPDDFLHSIWDSRLPSNIRATLAGQTEVELDTAARFPQLYSFLRCDCSQAT
jgi:hypothetical protein